MKSRKFSLETARVVGLGLGLCCVALLQVFLGSKLGTLPGGFALKTGEEVNVAFAQSGGKDCDVCGSAGTDVDPPSGEGSSCP